MCLSCGCGEPNERHHDGDITMDDIDKAAENATISPQEVAKNIEQAVGAAESASR